MKITAATNKIDSAVIFVLFFRSKQRSKMSLRCATRLVYDKIKILFMR